MSRNDLLENELHITLRQVNAQISAMTELFGDRPKYDLYNMKYQDGKFVMVDILAAKAQILNGLAVIKAARTK